AVRPFVDLSTTVAGRSGLDEFEFEFDLDLVGHEKLTAAEDGVEGHAEVLAVDRAGRRQSGDLVAVRVGGDTGEFGRDRDFLVTPRNVSSPTTSNSSASSALIAVDLNSSFGCSSARKKSPLLRWPSR